jgi:cysteine desulfurase
VAELNRRLRDALATLGGKCRPQIHAADDASPYILSVAFPGYEGEVLARLVEQEGVVVGTGSACSARSGQPSHVLTAMGVAASTARGTLRFSFGHATKPNDIDRLACALRIAQKKY